MGVSWECVKLAVNPSPFLLTSTPLITSIANQQSTLTTSGFNNRSSIYTHIFSASIILVGEKSNSIHPIFEMHLSTLVTLLVARLAPVAVLTTPTDPPPGPPPSDVHPSDPPPSGHSPGPPPSDKPPGPPPTGAFTFTGPPPTAIA